MRPRPRETGRQLRCPEQTSAKNLRRPDRSKTTVFEYLINAFGRDGWPGLLVEWKSEVVGVARRVHGLE
jgi:hypothetical protein